MIPLESMNPFDAQLRRRQFLTWSGLLLTSTAVGLRFYLPAHGPQVPKTRNLSEDEAKILAVVFSVITLDSDPTSIQKAITLMDDFLGQINSFTRRELRLGLRVLEHSPILFHGIISRFTQCSFEDQTRIIRGWNEGAWWRHAFFTGVKDLCYLAHYSQKQTWERIGYDGPPVNPEEAIAPFDSRYLEVFAKNGMRPKGTRE